MGARQNLYCCSVVVFLASLLTVVAIASGVEIGQKAPDFTLQSTTGEKIRLSHFRAKSLVLLEFYVADFAAT